MCPRWAAARMSTIVRRSSRERASSGGAAALGPVWETCTRVSYLLDEVARARELPLEQRLVRILVAGEAPPRQIGRHELVQEDQCPLESVQRIENVGPRQQALGAEPFRNPSCEAAAEVVGQLH